MARSKLYEPLQSHTFWIVDIAPVDALALPIFLPTLGFKSISAPEISLDFMTIKEGNCYFPKKVIRSTANVSEITLHRGVRFFDSDFSRWIYAALTGNPGGFPLPVVGGVGRTGGPTPRRDLLLIHFFTSVTTNDLSSLAGDIALLGVAALSTGGLESGIENAASFMAQYGMAKVASGDLSGVGPFDHVGRLPAKAYMLRGCIPTRYKVGSDFDASSAEISIAELGIQYEILEELSLTS